MGQSPLRTWDHNSLNTFAFPGQLASSRAAPRLHPLLQPLIAGGKAPRPKTPGHTQLRLRLQAKVPTWEALKTKLEVGFLHGADTHLPLSILHSGLCHEKKASF